MAARTIQVPQWDSLDFSYRPTGYTYVQEYKGCWEDYTLSQSSDHRIHQAASAINYGQGIFEGLKAQRNKEGTVMVFRPELNAARLQDGAKRMCMQKVVQKQFINAIKLVVQENHMFVPPFGKGSLYIRPLLLGSGPKLGIGPAPSYSFIIFVSPVGPYFKDGTKSIRLKIPEDIHRATLGGTGCVKAIGNYAPGMYHVCKAKEEGFDELLYLDARNNTYIEECGAANFFTVKDGVLYTPPLSGTILPGITRRSVLEIAEVLGIPTEICPLKVSDVFAADECFCTGTAAGVTPVGSIVQQDVEGVYHGGVFGPVTQKLRDALQDVKSGAQHKLLEPFYEWNMRVG